MSNNGAIVGSYQTKCTVINNQPKETFCYYSPWFYDGSHVTKIQWPYNTVAYGMAINDSRQVSGSEYGGKGWIYSAGSTTYTTGTGGAPIALNNAGIGAGTVGGRAVTYTNGVGTQVYFNDPYLSSPTTTTWAVDINDAGFVAGYYADGNGNYPSFVVDATGNVTFIPMLSGQTQCKPVRMSQANPTTGQIWVAGNCYQRAFVFEVTSGTLIELANIPGATNVQVSSINSSGAAVGTTTLAGGVGTVVMWPAGTTSSTIPTDLNANNAFAPADAMYLRAIDMDEAGDILTSYFTLPANTTYVLLHPIP